MIVASDTDELALPTDALQTEPERNVAAAVRAFIPWMREAAFELDQEPDLAKRHEGLAALYATAHEIGCHRAWSSTNVGGLGLGARARAIMLEELARGDAGLAITVCQSMNQAHRIEVSASDEAKERFLTPFLQDESGAWQLGGAGCEPEVGSDVLNYHYDGDLHTTITRVDDEWEIDGTKWMTTNAGCAKAYVVSAQSSEEHGYAGRRWALMSPDTAGISHEPLSTLGLRTSCHARVTFDRVRVPDAHLLRVSRFPDVAARVGALSAGLGSHSVQMAAMAVGVAQAAWELAHARALVRVQGGRPIAEHPTLRVRFAEVRGFIEQARATVWTAAALEDVGVLDAVFGAAAKASANHAARTATAFALEVYGSHGIVDSHPVSKLLRDAHCMAPAVGTTDLVRLIAFA